jgi:hypothetical protein
MACDNGERWNIITPAAIALTFKYSGRRRAAAKLSLFSLLPSIA